MSHTSIDQHTRTALVVVAHHRSDSLTAHLARRTVTRLEADGYRVDLLDLRAEGFDPRMTEADQPDWGNREKTYSPEVHEHMDRMLAADVVVAVFPVYWASLPALLKGWIDRVWNYGFAYGRSKPRLAGKRILWLGLAGMAAGDPLVEFMQQTLDGQLNMGIAYYCGFSYSAVGVLRCPMPRSAASASTPTDSSSWTRSPPGRNAWPSTPNWSDGPTSSSRTSLPPKRLRPERSGAG